MGKRKDTYEGLQNNVRKLRTPKIEVWRNKYADKDYVVELDFSEFTCICPKTGLPDFATIHISYIPDKVCVELKSLKLYMVSYRSVGVFHEHVVNKVLQDLVNAMQPRYIEVVGEFNVRGGIKTTVKAQAGKR